MSNARYYLGKNIRAAEFTASLNIITDPELSGIPTRILEVEILTTVFGTDAVFSNINPADVLEWVDDTNADLSGLFYFIRYDSGTSKVYLNWISGDIKYFDSGPYTGNIIAFAPDYSLKTLADGLHCTGEINYEKEEESDVVFSTELTSELTFTKDIYVELKELFDSCYKNNIWFKIDKFCNSTTKTKYIGYFTISDVTFDFKKCSATVKPFSVDLIKVSRDRMFKRLNIVDICEQNDFLYYNGLFNEFESVGYYHWNFLQNAQQILLPFLKGVVSTFYQLNDPGDFDYASTPLDTAIIDRFKHIGIFSLSDATQLPASDPATIIETSLFEFLNFLKYFNGIEWTIWNGYLRLEHSVYFTNTNNYSDDELLPDKIWQTDNQNENVEFINFGQGSAIFRDITITYKKDYINQKQDTKTKIVDLQPYCFCVVDVVNKAQVSLLPQNVTNVGIFCYPVHTTGAGNELDYADARVADWDADTSNYLHAGVIVDQILRYSVRNYNEGFSMIQINPATVTSSYYPNGNKLSFDYIRGIYKQDLRIRNNDFEFSQYAIFTNGLAEIISGVENIEKDFIDLNVKFVPQC